MKINFTFSFYLTVPLLLTFHLSWSQGATLEGWYEQGRQEMIRGEYKAAVKSFAKAEESCIKQGRKDDICQNACFNIGICALKLKQYKVATERFTLVIQENPNDHEAYIRRAAAYSQMGEKHKALSDCNKAQQIARPHWESLPVDTRALYLESLALACRDVHQLQAAALYLQRSLDLRYEAESHLELLRIKLQIGQVAEVEEALRDPRLPLDNNLHLNLIMGQIKMLKGQYDKAIEYFDDVKEERDIDAAYRNLVYCYIQLNYMDAARKYLDFLADRKYNETERAFLESQLATREGRWEEAIDWADIAESLHSDLDTLLPHIRLQRARVHYRQGDFIDAIGECRLVNQHYPNHPHANSLQGLAYLEMGDIPKAQAVLSKCLSDHPNHPIVLARWHWMQFRAGGTEKSMQALLQLVGEYPQLAEIRYYYAECCHRSSKYSPHECETNLDMALGWFPSMGDAHALKALMLLEKGDADAAGMYVKRAEELGVSHSFGAAHLAQVYLATQQARKALELSERKLKSNKEPYPQKWHALALVENGHNQEAINYLMPLIQQHPQHWEWYKIRGMAKANQGQHREALADWEKAVGIHAYDAELFRLRGRAYAIFGNWEAALLELNEATILRPGYVEAFYDIGRTHLDRRDYPMAAAALETALSYAPPKHPQIGMICNDLGLAKAELNDPYGAMGFFNQGIEWQPSELLYENRAQLQVALGKLPEAIEDFQRAIQSNGNDPTPYYELGRVQKSIHQYLEAAQSFSFAITIRIRARMEVPKDYYQQRGECYLALGSNYLTQAEGDFIHTREANPDDWRPLYYLGKCKYGKGDFRRALEYFSNSIVLDSEREEVYVARGDAFSQVGQFTSAARDYGQASRLNPGEICYQKKKGHAHLRDENWIAAIEQYEATLDWAIQNGYEVEVELYHGIGKAYSGKGHAEESDIAYQLAIRHYQDALAQPDITEEQEYYIQLNMMTTYEKWGMPHEVEAIRAQLKGNGKYQEPNVVGC